MYLIRDIVHCKPGKVRDMVAKFKAISGLMSKKGMKPFRVLTDVSGDRFWTVIGETEAETVDQFMAEMEKGMSDPEAQKIMTGYHDLVVEGRREVYKIEA